MGVRTGYDMSLQVGRENSLASGSLIADVELSAVLDTLARGKALTVSLDAGETGYAIPFGDIAEARLVYLEADGEVQVTPGAPGAATAAQVTGVAGTFVTGFVGGETLDIDVDNFGVVNVIFDAADQSAQQVANRINAAFAVAGFLSAGVPYAPARVVGGEISILSPSTGVSSEVEIVAGGTALATLGLSATVVNGVNAIAGQTPIQLYRPANTSSASLAEGVKSFLFATMRTTSLLLDNLDPDNSVEVTVVIAGDVLAEPPSNC